MQNAGHFCETMRAGLIPKVSPPYPCSLWQDSSSIRACWVSGMFSAFCRNMQSHKRFQWDKLHFNTSWKNISGIVVMILILILLGRGCTENQSTAVDPCALNLRISRKSVYTYIFISYYIYKYIYILYSIYINYAIYISISIYIV